MEDLADALKSQYLGIRKMKSEIPDGLQNHEAKTTKCQELSEKRKIASLWSPSMAQQTKRQKMQEVEEEQLTSKTTEADTNKRLEMLRKWKVEKERRLASEKKNAKPIFKVCNVPQNVGFPDLENVNREIKGKKFTTKFHPSKHVEK